MRVAVLGPLVVTANDSAPVRVPGAQERLLLAVLAARAPDVVPADRLAGVLADVDALQAAVHRLRAALEPRLPDRSSGQYVLRRGPGYALAVPRSDVDASRFTDLALRGHARLAQDPRDAEWLLTTALGLWRGEPYDEWPEPFFHAERARLTELRSRAEADLLQARATASVPVVGSVRAVRPQRASPVRTIERPPVPLPREELPPAPEPPPPAPPAPRSGRQLALVSGLLLLLVGALTAARLSGRSEQQMAQAATVADANQMAALSRAEPRLDLSLLLAVQGFRLADTPTTRDALARVLDGHERVERAVSFYGVPQQAVLSGGRTLTFGVGVSVVGWPVGPSTVPREIMPIPGQWGDWNVAAPSPVDDVLLGAGMGRLGPWIRRVSTLDGTSRLLVEGSAIGGQPVAGAMSPDGRQFHLVVATPDDVDDRSSHWHLVDVDALDGSVHPTTLGGPVGSPVDRVAANFAENAGSFVVWDDDTASPTGTLVQLADGRQVSIPVEPGNRGSRGFHAYPGGVVQLWDDGGITLVDRDGKLVQELGAYQQPVLDVAVAPDGRWAVTGGSGGEVFRWDVDPVTGRWYDRQPLRGHTGDVVSVEMDAAGQLLATVSVDHTAITWDMRPDGARRALGWSDPQAQLRAACSIAGRDLTTIEWRRALPDRPWRPTCSDLV